MKVYVAEAWIEYEGSSHVGIFSSVAKAKKALKDAGHINTLKPLSKERGFYRWKAVSGYDWATISTFELDKTE